MESPMAELIRQLFSRHWFVVLGGGVAAIYLIVFLWKIIISQEGFLFGYGNWVIGKWRSHPEKGIGDKTPTEVAAKALSASPHRLNVLKLSHVVDLDIAYLMVNDSSDWSSKIQSAFQTIVSGVTRVVGPAGHCRCGLFILDDDERHLVLIAGEGYGNKPRPRLVLERSCAGRSFLTGDTYYCKDIQTDPVYYHPAAHGKSDFRSIACVPVRAGHAIFGVLCLDAQEPGAFTEDDFLHLGVFAAKMAVLCAFYSLQSGAVCEIEPSR